MDLKEKLVKGLANGLHADYVRLEDDEGISGFVVSSVFQGISSFDRQQNIEAVVSDLSLSQDERRRILMFAGLTPDEYAAVGAPIRVQRVKEKANGEFEVVLFGGASDAEFVRGTFTEHKGTQTTEPKPVKGAGGTLMFFLVKSAESNPLTKDQAIRMLKKNRYIEVLSNA